MALGLQFHYVQKGDATKPLMVFVHGFPEFWYSWRYQLQEFYKDYWVVALDMRGYGDSDKPEGVNNYDIKYLVEDIAQFVKELVEDIVQFVKKLSEYDKEIDKSEKELSKCDKKLVECDKELGDCDKKMCDKELECAMWQGARRECDKELDESDKELGEYKNDLGEVSECYKEPGEYDKELGEYDEELGECDKKLGECDEKLGECDKEPGEFGKELGRDKFTLVAHDWGGIVAWRFVDTHAHMLNSYIIMDAPRIESWMNMAVSNMQQFRKSWHVLH
uniref:AB hydrolase-1 domain-containing protein n=1 Tax=Timema douglasi TaxID=61478 RepID=A0A7R8ZGE0_TIMDO|nr:unnamed protein product [Timema douglasi]